jgi:hypothetical protein
MNGYCTQSANAVGSPSVVPSGMKGKPEMEEG